MHDKEKEAMVCARFVFAALVSAITVSMAGCGTPSQTSTAQQSKTVLGRIETYKAPKRDTVAKFDIATGSERLIFGIEIPETYESRKKSGSPLPPTLSDALVCDIYQLAETRIGTTNVTSETVVACINVYLTKNADEIAGLRPWTHWNFIRSLDSASREKLVIEIVERVKTNGLTCPD